MPDECNELPDLPIGHVPRRHAGVSDTVANVVEDFSIRDRGNGCSKRWRARVLARTDLSLSAAVKSVADLALLFKQGTADGDLRRIILQRIGARCRFGRDTAAQ